MRSPARVTPVLVAAAAALVLAACSDGTAPDRGEPFTAQQTAEVGTAASDEAVETATAFIAKDATIHEQGTASFTPDAGQTLVVGQARPSGAISLTGTVGCAGRVNADLTVQTVTPLHYDASCADLGFGPARRIAAGELRLARVVDGVSKGYVQVVWSACGRGPTHTFVTAG